MAPPKALHHTVEVILSGMTMRIGPKGQVVIPKAFRDRLGLRPGDEVDWVWIDGALQIEPVPPGASPRGRYASLPLLETLEADRRLELDR
jgi:AbrB family looped-hinge helix DNA binding protein